MTRAIVTGATGFIGRALTEKLLEQGTEVWAVVRDGRKLDDIKSKNLYIVEADFAQYPYLVERIDVRGFDVCFHLAWEGYGAATNDSRVQVRNVHYACEAAKAATLLETKRFVFADSSHEYLMSDAVNGQTDRCSIYGTAKYCASQMCRTIAHNAGIDFVGVLFVNIFGVGDRSNRSTNTILRRLLRNEDLDLATRERLYNWTYIDDCIGGVIAAAKEGKSGKVYYVGTPPRPFGAIIEAVCEALNKKVQLHFGAFPDNTWIDFEDMDTDALYRDTGFECTSDFAGSICRTAAWLTGGG